MLATVDSRTIAIFVHVAAIIVAFGAVLAYPIFWAAAKRGGPAALAFWHTTQNKLGRTLISFGSLVALAAGMYLVTMKDHLYKFGDWWVGTAFLILIVINGLGGAYFGPTERKLAALAQEAADSGSELPAEYQEQADKLEKVQYVAIALIVIAVFLMVTKPGSPG